MQSNPFWHFLALSLFKERSRHIFVIFISILILFLLSAVLFISSSIQFSLKQSLDAQADFIVSKQQGDRALATPLDWADELIDLYGISKVTPRVYGRYFFEDKSYSALIVGVDFMEEQSQKNLEKLIEITPARDFLQSPQMLVGQGVQNYLNAHFYPKDYRFMTPQGDFITINIFQTLPSQTQLIANDMIVMPIDLAREILGYGDEESRDIALSVPNEETWDNLADKISALHYDIRIISKKEVANTYTSLYNYKGGIFLMLYLIVLLTFSLLLYQRYSIVYASEKRHIGLLRAVGWSIEDVLKLKFTETILVILFSYLLGLSFAYIFVFVLDAPLLQMLFLGGQNLSNTLSFVPIVDVSILLSIFLMYALPFLASVLFPVWKIAITDPKEAML